MPFPFITLKASKNEQIDKIYEELFEFTEADNSGNREHAAIEFQDLHQALLTFERNFFTPEEINKARAEVIDKNRIRGYYGNYPLSAGDRPDRDKD